MPYPILVKTILKIFGEKSSPAKKWRLRAWIIDLSKTVVTIISPDDFEDENNVNSSDDKDTV